jgi:hypothetical protein
MSTREAAEVLGVPLDADQTVIKRAFRVLARQLHPDLNKSPDAEDRFKRVAEAYEVLGGRGSETEAPPRGRETLTEQMERRRREAEARLRRQAAAAQRPTLKPEYEPEVLLVPLTWGSIIPGVEVVTEGAFLGVRRDGNVELHVKGTYKTSSPSLAAMVFKLIKLVQLNLQHEGKPVRDWEVYITFLGFESPPRLEVYALHELADRVNLRRSGDDVLPPHAPRARGGTMDPSDFS